MMDRNYYRLIRLAGPDGQLVVGVHEVFYRDGTLFNFTTTPERILAADETMAQTHWWRLGAAFLLPPLDITAFPTDPARRLW